MRSQRSKQMPTAAERGEGRGRFVWPLTAGGKMRPERTDQREFIVRRDAGVDEEVGDDSCMAVQKIIFFADSHLLQRVAVVRLGQKRTVSMPAVAFSNNDIAVVAWTFDRQLALKSSS